MQKWCTEEGYLDYVAPQIYWERNHPTAPFGTVLEKWENLLAGRDVDLYIGLATYKFANSQELIEQENLVENSGVAKGYIHFRYDYL